jgi:Na+-driven multidrug efflux pump
MGVLTDNPEVISIGAIYLIVMGIVQIPQNVASLLNGALRGAGYPKAPMINAGIGLWIIRIPLILLVTYVLKSDIIWIWVIMGIDLVSRFFLALIGYKNRDIFNHFQDIN